MNVTDPNLVIVRGINDKWYKENLSEMWIGFGGSPTAIPVKDSYFVGLYIHEPVSAIKFIGVVSQIDRYNDVVDFYIKALIELPTPIKPIHAIRKHEYWTINDFNLSTSQIDLLRQLVAF